MRKTFEIEMPWKFDSYDISNALQGHFDEGDQTTVSVKDVTPYSELKAVESAAKVESVEEMRNSCRPENGDYSNFDCLRDAWEDGYWSA